ncbi:methyl-accepting chemotaxis protein [Propionivibrio limicola]|uniref:methyl-accepting chemotaxis protein n=1 Tax=Propionivibrio limicola TaxID=167645 RepID=UPI0012912B66|nr:methyl-accepting chemotaxis protein [Propionivibrio limicola]
MALNLRFPKFLSRSKDVQKQDVPAPTVVDDNWGGLEKKKPLFELGVLRRYPITKKLQILGGGLLLLMLIIGALVYRDNRESTFNTAYVATAGEMRMLSQRLAKASNLAMQGDPFAFRQLRDSRDKFASNLGKLTNGGELFGVNVPPSPDGAAPQLQVLTKAWASTEKNANQLLSLEKTLVLFGVRAFAISENSDQLLELAEALAAQKMQGNSSVREVAAANQLVMLTQRIAKNAGMLRLADSISPEVAFQLGRDTKLFSELLESFLKGSDAESKPILVELDEAYKGYQSAVAEILGSMQELVFAKQAGARIFVENEALLEAADVLAGAYQRNVAEQAAYVISLIVLVAAALAVLALMAKIYLDDTRRQAELAEKSRQESEAINRQNQDAILRLMNELGDLADGDLTVLATVSEDITGAIADSINYTVEELRVLVGRINDAASRVTSATEIAQQTSAELLLAAKRQSEEIQEAGHSVLSMASSMTKVSDEADQSAQVARQSLQAAGKGAQAVQDSIKGMDGIREQIQETSKRIKRLGESSQEIGEIVELISDITEQTNVLALNAAIQAASAGDAGRGFSVVAEEVQRLAERSGEATKQIAAIVKTIQTDTQGAVSAMEESTRGVVEGAKLSDAAGQALAEIGMVSQNLAELIESISSATRQQADSATSVASLMQDILHVTEQTTAGTQKTATAVGELASLATELKGSVAGFKVA